ncbi:MAG: hypothetical protein ABIY52_07360, partial [Gemmatimonadaceae bacterium]
LASPAARERAVSAVARSCSDREATRSLALSSLAKARGAVTPGAGFRYRSPLGVLRLDVGIRPVGAQSLPVVVATTGAQGGDDVIRLAREKSWSPIDPSPGGLRSIARRLVVHFAMGQAF